MYSPVTSRVGMFDYLKTVTHLLSSVSSTPGLMYESQSRTEARAFFAQCHLHVSRAPVSHI